MNRKSGFYWVEKVRNNWEVAEYLKGAWWVIGNPYSYMDKDFVSIGEYIHYPGE